jgi:hypothetical protein
MTCIAVVRDEINNKIYMAGERGASDDGTILALSSPKVWKLGPYLIGYAGSMDGERIRYNFTHDGGYEFMSEEEVKEWDDGGDPCCHVVRLMI